MISHLLTAIEHVVLRYGSFGIFAGVFFEEVISIIPSVGVVMTAGFVFLGGKAINLDSFSTLLFHIAIPAALGLTLGSLFIYSIVYAFGKDVVVNYGKYARISWRDIEKLQSFMHGHKYVDNLILFAMRAIPIIPFAVTNAFCGLIRWKPVSYIIISFLGAIIRTSLMAFAGWQLGHLYKENIILYRHIELLIGLGILVLLIGFLFYRYFKSKNNSISKIS